MNKETYEALKRIIKCMPNAGRLIIKTPEPEDIQAIEDWIDEVAKEYTETTETNDEFRECSTCVHRNKKPPRPCSSCDQESPSNFTEYEDEKQEA